MQRTRKAFAVAAMTLALVAQPAHAAPPTPAQRAESALKEGIALDKAGKAEAALVKLEESYAIVPTGAAAFQIAHAEATLGRHTLALLHYREALRDTKLSTDSRRDAESAIESLKTKVGVLTLDIPDGASATVDGNEVDVKQPVEVNPGTRVVKVRLGGETRSVDVTALAGTVTPVKIRFDTPPPPATPPSGVVAEPAKDAGTRWPGVKIGVVGGAAAVGVGLLTASVIIFATADDSAKAPSGNACADRTAPRCGEFADARESWDSARTASTIFFYSGAIVGVAAVAAALFWPNERVTATARGLTVRF